MATPPLRVYLTGPVTLEAGTLRVSEHQFPGRQGRLVFAHLVCQRLRPVPRDELAELLWPGDTPTTWETSLSALVSKLRSLLQRAGLSLEAASISSHLGGYQAHLPSKSWVDMEAAYLAIDEAEGALRAGDRRAAWGPANVAIAIARRPFLPGDDGHWVESQRRRLHDLLIRGLDCLFELSLQNGEAPLAVQYATEVVALEPFRETGYQRLMRAHAAVGNRAEALRVFDQCRRLLAGELGTRPSTETETLYLTLLRRS